MEILNVFNSLTFKQFFWKRKTSLWTLEYYFLVESEDATFPYKTALPEANTNTNRMGRTRCFASNYFTFWKFYFGLWTDYKELIWCSNYPNVHIHTIYKRWSFISEWFFYESIFKHTSKYMKRRKQKLKVNFGKEMHQSLNWNLSSIQVILLRKESIVYVSWLSIKRDFHEKICIYLILDAYWQYIVVLLC